MSEELELQVAELESIILTLRRLAPAIWVLMIGAFSLGIWVTTLQFQQLRNTDQIDDNKEFSREIALWRASTDANRFTSGDGVKMQATFVDILNNQDKRLQRSEDTLLALQKTLQRIEEKLQ